MEFRMERANEEQLAEIMNIIEEAKSGIQKKEWFAADDEEFIRNVLVKNGFIICAWECESGEMAGYFSVVFPDRNENMGTFAGLSGRELQQVVYLDSAAVKGKFRGQKLQQKMLKAAEAELLKLQEKTGQDCQYRMCSVHPENRYSLENMMENGYEIAAETQMYGGLRRYVLCKKVQV